jgi:poly-beta-1,6-N-acetyl-D-glucosamine synthase
MYDTAQEHVKNKTTSLAEIKYVLITPVRDEEEHLESTIQSMVSQTICPAEWIIVNDGSSDRTGEIIDDYSRRYPWIRGVHRENRGFRKSGGGVVEAFNDGLRTLQSVDWDFIVKLDGDLAFSADYFESCFRIFQREPQLGLGGGVICYVDSDGSKTFEVNPTFHVRGATKIYRRACWEAIGGFWPAPGWDTIDEVKANMLGFTTRSFPELHLIHHRVTGAADGQLGNLIKNGRANYISGYHPLFMLAKCVSRLIQRPFVTGSCALMYGFVTGYTKGIAQVDDPRMIRYLRREQIRKLLGKKTVWN